VTRLPSGAAWLFCPADRPERFAKAMAAADVVILDLEDGVAAAARPAARQAIRAAAADLDHERVVIRVNAVGTPDHELDLAAVADGGYGVIMLAKAETPASLDALGELSVVALCETPAGVLAAPEIARHPACAALMWGAEDLMAALGGSSSRGPDGRYREVARYARSAVLLAAAAASKTSLDAVYLDIADLDGLADEAADAVASGFGAKAAIHPSQAAVIRRSFAPDERQLEQARRIVEAAEANPHGVFALDGVMIDEPLVRQARRILALGDL
jgi:citrate lyase subunit beta/citryl-CoA lyase